MLDSQSKWELDGLIYLLEKHNIHSMLEIGTKNGSTLRYLSRKLNLTRVVCVDNDPGYKLQKTLQKIRHDGTDARFIHGDSTDEKTVATVASYAPFDFVFIDGDHAYDTAYADWMNYKRFARFVAFHDIDGDNKGESFEVGDLWRRVKLDYKTFEIIEYGRQMGIGVAWI